MPDYDYSVLYEPMLQQFQYYVDVMLQALPVWLPIVLPITGAIVLIELSVLLFKCLVSSAIVDTENIASHFYTPDYEDMFFDEYDVEMYGSFIESMEEIEERNYEKYLNDDYSDFESFMDLDDDLPFPEVDESTESLFDTIDNIDNLPTYDFSHDYDLDELDLNELDYDNEDW